VLTGSGLTIGRDPANDIVFADPGISRRHARVDWDGAQATVTDLGSGNGTTVGSVRLTAHVPHVWPPGDLLTIGPFWVMLAGVDTQDIAAAPAPPSDLMPAPPAEPEHPPVPAPIEVAPLQTDDATPLPPIHMLPPVEPPAAPAEAPVVSPPVDEAVASPMAAPTPAPVQSGGFDRRKWLKWGGIGCAGLIGLCVVVGVIATLLDSDDDGEAAAATTPTVATTVAPESTATPQLVAAVTGTPADEQVVIAGCGGATIEYAPWEREIPDNIDQWNRIVNAANAITDAWNGYVAATNTVQDFDSVVDNVAVSDAATALTTAVETNRPAIAAETDPDSKFGTLAQAELNLADAFAELARLTAAAAAGDVDAWNSSIDQQEIVNSRIAESQAETDAACSYFRSIND
jgi:hypothetical protein